MITLDPPKQKNRSLKALQEAQLPRLDWQEVLKVGDPSELTEADYTAMRDYFRQFVRSANGCIKCGAQQGGNMLDAFIGKAHFTWGLANGEGFCSNCKYPARAYHRKVGPIDFLNLILQYHPDELSDKSPSDPNGSKRSDAGGVSSPKTSALPSTSLCEQKESLNTGSH